MHDARAAMASHYEAGRAMACWWGGVGLKAINMPWNSVVNLHPRASAAWLEKDPLVRFLNEEPCGIPEGVASPRTRAWQKFGRMEVALMTCYAGSVAWARHRKRSIGSCLAGDGRADAERAEAISDAYFTGGEAFNRTAALSREMCLVYATKLVRSRQGWTAISSIADWLLQCGFISGLKIDLCFAAFGAGPLVVGWDLQWPPCHGDLDGGYMAQAHWPWYWQDDCRDAAGNPLPTVPNPYLTHSPAR